MTGVLDVDIAIEWDKDSKTGCRPMVRKWLGRNWRESLATILAISYIILFTVAAMRVTLKGTDQATMSNTFATITGVLLGLYFVIPKSKEARRWNALGLTLFLSSILASLTSSMISLDPTSSSSESRGIFLASVALFAQSTAFFALATAFLSEKFRFDGKK